MSDRAFARACCVLLPLLLAVNVLLVPAGSVYGMLLALQLTFYASALAGHLLRGRRPACSPLLTLPNFVVAANVAAIVGGLRLATGRQTVLWQRTRP